MIKNKSTYSYKFRSVGLTKSKFEQINLVCTDYLKLKNEVSKTVYDNHLEECLRIHNVKNKSSYKHAFSLKMRAIYTDEYLEKNDFHLTQSIIDSLYENVYTDYTNRVDSVFYKLSFEYRGEFDHYEFYKKTTKKHKEGDFKSIVYKIHTDENGEPLHGSAIRLARVLTYLCRYGNDNTLEYINDNYEKVSDEQKLLYDDVLYFCNKFSFERLMQLALSKRNRIFKRKITYRSKTFKGNARLENIIDYNKRYNSKINAFITLSWLGRGTKMHIPVSYSEFFYGDIKELNKRTRNHRYIVKVDEKTQSVTVILTKLKDRNYTDADPSYSNIAGIDVNYKHNMFTIYDGKQFYTFDYDRKLLKEYAYELKKIDRLKARDENYVIGKHKSRKLEHLSREMLAKERETIVSACKLLNSLNINHAAMEDLNRSFNKCYARDETVYDINYNRLFDFLHLSSLKDEFRHIAENYNICLSTVHAAYTSQQCSVCGCIDSDNRLSQENFCCIEDNQHSMNADENAAVNIRNRVFVTVLRNSLLQECSENVGKGVLEPKPMKRSKVKNTLLELRSVVYSDIDESKF